MFRRMIFMVFVLVFSFAQFSLASAEEKIALVNLQRALVETNDGKKIKAKLDKDYDTKKKEIDVLKVDLETLSKQFDNEKNVLSQTALRDKTETLQKKYLELQNKAASYQRELKVAEAEGAQKILIALAGLVTKYAQKEGYTLVIENSAQLVLFAKSADDITDKIILAYNKGER